MAKRSAGDQITRETYGTADSDDDSPAAPMKASSAVMSRRKILKPRGHRGGSENTSSTANTPTFGSFKPSAPPSSNFTFGSSAASTTTNGSSDRNERIRALNEQFLASIKKAEAPNTIADLSGAAGKYIDYYKQIVGAPSANAFPTQTPAFGVPKPASVEHKEPATAPKQPEVQKLAGSTTADKSSDSESDDEEVKIEGPKFTFDAKPAKNLPFSFGPKQEKKKDDSDSESEVELKGPVFSFDKPIKDNVFKFPAKTDDNKKANATTTTETSLSQPIKPAFNFAFGGESKPDQLIASSTSESQPKSASAFGATSDNQKPLFSFLTTNDNTAAKPFPVFGASSQSSATDSSSKPTFGTESAASKPAFTFGSSAQASNDVPNSNKPTFPTFGAVDSGEKKSNSLPSEKDDSQPKSLFGFSSNQSAFSSSGAFGLANKTQPTFNFAASKGTENDSKSTAEGESKPAFSFGSLTTTSKPFTFGNATLPNASSGFSFGSTNAKPAASSTEENGDEKPEGDDQAEAGGNFEPIAKLSKEEVDVSTGEEGEEVLFTKRAKLMLFDPSNKEQPYANKGLGDVRVLKAPSGKSRVLMRADGSSRVLINTLVSGSMSYSTMGNGSMVRVPIVNNETKAIETYVLKLKLAADGENLQKLLEEIKL